jgi:predicted type IV restriction endonuclease
MAIPARVRERLSAGLKRLVPIILQQKARDVSEADTVTLVKDLLSEVFGYDKYTELTAEHCIRGTYCDLAVKLNDKVAQIIEVKSAGSELDDRHVKQAIDYCSNLGIEWAILTNGSIWRLYQVIFAKPIDRRLLAEIDLTAIDWKKDSSLEALYLLTKEGFLKGAHIELRDRQDATSRFTLAALITENDNVRSMIRRELRRVVDVLVDESDIVKVLKDEVIKRDALEGPDADAAIRRVNRSEKNRIVAVPAGRGEIMSMPETAPAPAAEP